MSSQNKLLFASLIKERKDILFGKFTNTLTHEVKTKEWKQILSSLNDQGIFNGKDYKYLRDIAWQNIKRATLNKLSNSERKGSARRYKRILNDLDKIIISIIGKESPTVHQRSIDESSSILSDDVAVLPLTVKIEEEEGHQDQEESKLPSSSGKMRLKRKNASRNHEEDILFLQRKKLQLEVYNLQLDAIKKELELGLPSRSLTAEVEKESESDLNSTSSEGIANLKDF